MDALSNAYSQRGRMKPLCYGFISIALSEVNYLNVGVSPRCVLIRGSQVENTCGLFFEPVSSK